MFESPYSLEDLPRLTASGKTARFHHFKDGSLWFVTDCGFEFPVPVTGLHSSRINAQESTVHLHAWIQQHLEAAAAGHIKIAAPSPHQSGPCC